MGRRAPAGQQERWVEHSPESQRERERRRSGEGGGRGGEGEVEEEEDRHCVSAIFGALGQNWQETFPSSRDLQSNW